MQRGRAAPANPAHHLYVFVKPNDAARTKGEDLTLAVLKFVQARRPIFAKMGVQITVHRISRENLADARLRGAMKRQGITSLPALVTPNAVYAGHRAITEVYDRCIEEYRQHVARGGAEGPGGPGGPGGPSGDSEDLLGDFYRDEMRGGGPESTGGDEKIGEGGDMMSSYSEMMQRRDSGPPASAPAPAASAPVAQRRDNVAVAGESIAATIDRIAGPVTAGTREAAFSEGGGDSYDPDDEAPSAQDLLMEKAFWENQESSM